MPGKKFSDPETATLEGSSSQSVGVAGLIKKDTQSV